MLLADLLAPWSDTAAMPAIAITALTLDSRAVTAGTLFFAISGSKRHGLDFVPQVVTAGAVAVVYDPLDAPATLPQSDIPLLAIPQLNAKISHIAARFFGNPSASMDVIGVTGTNGKSSVCHFIAAALHFSGEPCGVIGTVGNGLYGQLQTTNMTTPDPVTVQQLLAQWLQQGVRYAVMEVSSHALVQHRVAAVAFRSALFTNLTRDHLDYHGTMQQYGAAKAQLFRFASLRHIVVNGDDSFSAKLLQQANPEATVSRFSLRGSGDVNATAIQHSINGSNFTLQYKNSTCAVVSKVHGGFSVANLTATAALLLVRGYTLDTIAQLFSNITAVSGRFEFIQRPNKPAVVVDYAHTPDALSSVLTSLRKLPFQKIWVVFGCGGDRDKGKRPRMGEIAAALADEIVLTSDNPRSESEHAIINDIVAGIPPQQRYNIISDRAQAIAYAIDAAAVADCVLIAGKGHETTQTIGSNVLPFSDQQYAGYYLDNRREVAA